MKECKISADSTCEEVAEDLSINCNLKEEDKNKFIKEGISGDALYMLDNDNIKNVLKINLGPRKRITNYLEENKDKFKPKEIKENIPIKNEEEIRAFFEKFIGFKGNLDTIKGENDLKQLKKEHMEKLELNLGQRIKLARYIDYFNSLKEKKEIKITITKETNDEDALNYLKNELNISQESIENLDLDSGVADLLLGSNALSEDDLNESLEEKKIKQEEYDSLMKFIKLRDEMKKKESNKISKNSSKEDISKFIKEKLNFDIEKQDIKELNLDKYKNISKEEEEILKNFIEQIKNDKKPIITGNNTIYSDTKIGNEDYGLITKDKKKRKYKNRIESKEPDYLKKELETFQDDSDYNIFFILSTKNKSFSDLRFAVFQKQWGMFNHSYINLDFYLINESPYRNKGQEIFMLLFQVVLENPINNFFINVKDLNNNATSPEFESLEIKIEKEAVNYFVLFIGKSTKDYFPQIYINTFFSEYLNYFFEIKNNTKKTIKKELIENLNQKISNTTDLILSDNNILQFIKYCGDLNISPSKLENIKLIEGERTINKKYYLEDKFIKDNFKPNERTMIYTIMLKIFANCDTNKLLEMINDLEICKLFFTLISVLPLQIKFNDIRPKMNANQIKELQNKLFRVINEKKDIQYIINMGDNIESSLNIIQDNLEKIIAIIDIDKNKFKGFQLNIPQINDNIENIYIYYDNIDVKFKPLNRQYNLLNKKDILEKMVDIYKNKNKIEEYLLLKNILEKDKDIDINIINQYRDNIHQKGMYLIENNLMTTEEIIKFVKEQDYYYSLDKPFIFSPKRDAKIFSYIGITSECPKYKENIKLIKDNELYKLYDGSTANLKDIFYTQILKQIKAFNDMESIFEIFPDKYINGRFLLFINEKFKNLLKLINENNCNISYSVIDKWLTVNSYAGEFLTNLGDIVNELNELNKFNKFTFNYYLYLLKNKSMKDIFEEIKNYIISFFIDQNNSGVIDEESLITLLRESPDDDFRVNFVKKIDQKILKEDDFYTKEETPNFEFFRLFLANVNKNLEEKFRGCAYVEDSIIIQTKIIEDLKNKNVQYEKMNNLISDDNIILDKIKVLTSEDEANKIYEELKESLEKCKKKLQQLELINDYYNQFYKKTKKEQIILIKNKLDELINMNISFLLAEDNFFKDNEIFDYYEAVEDSKKIKYRNSKFFMTIYEKNKDNYKVSEDERFKQSIKDYHEILTNIINLEEKQLNFFEIKNVYEILNIIRTYNYNLEEEINFTLEEFKDLNKEEYIKNDLLNDLIIYSKRGKTLKLLEGIKCFITKYEQLEKIEKIEKTEYFDDINNSYTKLGLEGVNKKDITEAIEMLLQKGFDINKETPLIQFFKAIKIDAIEFLKTLKDSNTDIRNLNEFVVENAASELQTSDIDNLYYVFEFFIKIFNNKEIKTDKLLIEAFVKELNDNQGIWPRIASYQKIYGEIKRVYDLYTENPATTIAKVNAILDESVMNIFKDEINNDISFNIIYKEKNDEKEKEKEKEKEQRIDVKGLEELKNKLLLSFNNSRNSNEENNEVQNDQEINSKKYINLIDKIKQLISTLNSLLSSGYPYIVDFKLFIKDSIVKDEEEKDLKDIMADYKEKNNKFKNLIKSAYEKFPLLRLFYGQQFIQLFNQTQNQENKNIFHLVNSITLNRVNNIKIDYEYNKDINELENINQYLEILFKNNGIVIDDLYEQNKVLEETKLVPGLYRRVKRGDNDDMINHILNLYLNLTNNLPIINTLLICNEDTSIENIQAFLYRAIFCDKPTLFVITNIECLELSIIKKIIRIIKILYKEKKNKKINSYILFFYEKNESGLARFLEKSIQEKNKLNESYFTSTEKKYEDFQRIEVYSAKYSGYGKTTEIKNKVKEKKGKYYYLPIGGTLTRDYTIKNLLNLEIDLKEGKENYLHLDLSETDNDDLLREILFKLLIMKYIDSKRNIYYLGYDLNLMVEIPKVYYNFNEKYTFLKLFNNIYIEELKPLRLEEGVKCIGDSPISIVAEVLSIYDTHEISMQNISLEAPITKTGEECEKIINKYFNVANQNYYQKMNFIKILSIQFKKFTESWYLNDPEAAAFLSRIREPVIYNFIELTKVFTRSPYDSILLRKQDESRIMFGKINENQAKEDELMKLADESNKQEIFSFEKIKPSLVFFNRDASSLSIISNNDKNEKNYKNLRLLWNLGNPILNNIEMEELLDVINFKKTDILNELINYKNLNHEEFLEQIKNIFCLDKFEIKDLKEICAKLGNYIFVSDNFIKIVVILLYIEARIPVILMGETGVGKTKLLEMLSILYGKGTPNWHKLQIHAGITDQKIIEFIEEVNRKYELQDGKKETVCIFFDEINTCNSLGLLTEIMCNRTYLGKKINENYVFLGACNPYRIITKKMRESGLVYYNTKDNNKLNNLVYTVNPLPHSLLNFIFDFGSLLPDDEKKYIKNTIIDIIARFKEKKIIPDFDKIEEDYLDKIKIEIIESISICHDFMRKKFDRSSVSLREIRRFGIFFEYFIKYFLKKKEIKEKNEIKENNVNNFDYLKDSLNMTLYLCYYLRLNEKKYREELAKELEQKIFKDFVKIPENEIKIITNQMAVETEQGIALNRALRENLFTCYICIDNAVPLIIVGKPGTGKSLSFQILYNTLKGEYSDAEIFKEKGKLYRYYYQGSGTSTSEGIKQVFDKALKAKINSEKSKSKIITLVFFDEMGLAERSINNPLKIIHYLLEKDIEDSVPFLGISNWKLDAAKINRALNLSITDYEKDDLEETAIAIAQALDKDIADRNTYFLQILAKTYLEYMKFIQGSLNENKDFHGNRDFYNLIKTTMKELIERRVELNDDTKKILTEAGLHALDRNFSGLEESNTKIKQIFKDAYKPYYDIRAESEKPFSVLDAVNKNISDSNTRYLLLISKGNDARDIVKYLLNSKNKRYIEIIGSAYDKDITSGGYSEKILNKIKYIMESDNILILKDLDMIYPSLYDLFNQNFTVMGDKKFARIAFEYAKISSEVNKDFHVIVLVNHKQIKNLKLDPPFLNRFEKHIINFNMLLDDRDKNIAKKIADYIELISSFNHNPNLKIDLDNLLINCQLHNFEGLIYKIKNQNNEINKKEGMDYEESLVKEVFKKIVPTFCQDLIASMVNAGVKPTNYNNIVLDIYNNSSAPNFISFLQKIKHRKNIIYTFSKIAYDIFRGNYLTENIGIKTEFGIINKQSTTVENIESIKAEYEIEFILQAFNDAEDQNLLILKFSEKDLNKISSIQFVIDNFEKKEDSKLQKKIIILLIYKQRLVKNYDIQKEEPPELISFFNEDYYQIFIDNLHGKENENISNIIQKNNDVLAEEYIYNPKFIKDQIFMVINYLNYKILFETKDLNKTNYAKKITEFILNNDFIQNQLIINLKKQRKTIKNDIKGIFISDNIDINDIDFIEVIRNKLTKNFCRCLLKIIYTSLNDNILNPYLINKDIENLLQNNYFNTLIKNYFENTKNPPIPLKMDINVNNIIIYNGLLIPKSKQNFAELVKYFEGKFDRFNKNEESLRNKYEDQKKIFKKENDYKINLKNIKNDLKLEIHKNIYFKEIFNMNIYDLFLNEYLKYYVIKYEENQEIINYDYNERLLNFLKLLIEIKMKTLEQDNNNEYIIPEPIDEFVNIFIFTQGYKNVIKELFNCYLEIIKYCDNFDEIMKSYLKEDLIKYEESQRNKKYTKIVNLSLFNILESFIRAILLYTQELFNKTEKEKFFEYFKIFPFIESSLQKINKENRLYSKEIYNLRNIIKIEDAYKDNRELFWENCDKIIENVLLQSTLFYGNNLDGLYKKVIELINIFDETFPEKNEAYKELLSFIYRQEYNNIYKEDRRIDLLEKFFKNELLLKNSKIFLVEKLKGFQPEFINEKSKKDAESIYLSNFLNTQNKKFENIQTILNICNRINKPEFNEILLFFFEGLCQSYFFNILEKYKNEYTEQCCNEMLLRLSYNYLKKAILYLYEHKEDNDNNLLKLYSIAFIKSYCYFYVEIHKNHFDKVNWEEINKLLFDKENIMNMRNIYVLRLYYKKLGDFDSFIKYDFKSKGFPIIDEISRKIKEDSINEGYVFNESFITVNSYENYNNILLNMKNEELNMDLINNNLDAFYCCLVNKTLSFKLGENKEQIHNNMIKIYNKSQEGINLGNTGKKIYEYLLNNNLFESEFTKNIITEENMTKKDLEILLYSLRFIFNMKEHDNKFYYNLLKQNAKEFIENNFIPGSAPKIGEFIKSYQILKEKFKLRMNMGYYICKDCGFLYEIDPCTFPMDTFECINGHICGGDDHVCVKKDIRVFYNEAEYEHLKEGYLEGAPENQPWFDAFEPLMSLDEFKEKYVDNYLQKKGIIKNYESKTFENLDSVREMNIITFRLLNFVLYSYLFTSYVLKNLTEEDIDDYSIKDYNNLFGLIKKNWELLEFSLKKKDIESVPIFINIIFDDIIEKINNLDFVDTEEKLNNFENDINQYITNIISNKEILDKKIKEYKSINKELNNINPFCLKEIIRSSFDPLIYEKEYPDIQYYSVSSLQNFETFAEKFNSSEENEKKYFLINLLVKKDQELTKDAINLESIKYLNKLGNILINIFSYKISRDEAKQVKLNEKLKDIYYLYNKMETQNEINNEIDTEDKFKEKYIEPFLKSWDKIKKKSIQYKCMVLKHGKILGEPLNMNMENNLCYFLVDIGDPDGGIFLASAYEHLIEWQNRIINLIIEQNKNNEGLLNMYLPQLEKEISIQDATENDIIIINEETYNKLNEIIMNCSMRNIYNKEGKLDYKNYYDNTYDYDYIEAQLAKLILQGKKRFKKDDINFVVYKYEELRGKNSSILKTFNEKYPNKELTEEEKSALNDLLKFKSNNKLYHDISSSIQLIMNQLIIDNYDQNKLLSDIIRNLPNFSYINEDLKNLLENNNGSNHDIFKINTLISIYEYFENYCWEENKKHIAPYFKMDLNEEDKQHVLDYFAQNETNEKKIIKKNNFTTALRRLISRYLISSRQESEIRPEMKLILYIVNEEFWSKDISNNDTFEKEIFDICKDGIIIGNSFKLYEILQGDKILNIELGIEGENPGNGNDGGNGGGDVPNGGDTESDNDDNRDPDDL